MTGADAGGLAGAVRAARERAALSQEELAERSGVSARSVSDIERGVSLSPRPATLRALAEALDVTVEALASPRPDRRDSSANVDARARDAPAFAALLREHRVARGLTQRELARAALMSERAISDLERGVAATTRRDTAAMLADALALDGLTRDRFVAAARGGSGDDIQERAFGHGIPQRRAPFVGHEAELAALVADIDAHRLVTLSGPGGIGKTTLAVAAAQSMMTSRRVGFVSLADATDSEAMYAALAHALDVREAGGSALEDLAVAAVGSFDLVVLDNLEQILDAGAAFVDRVLAEQPATKVLATSRLPLRLAGEHVRTVPPLCGHPGTPAADDPAVALFLEHARAEHPAWHPDAHDLALVQDICRRLDGLPLAIELAAAWIRELGLADIVAHLDRPLELLQGGRRDLADRHRAISATIDYSYELLTPTERAALSALSVCGAPFSARMAAALIANEPDDLATAATLARLVDAGLLARSEGDDTRYAWLVAVREFAASRLAADDMAVVRERLVATMLELAETAAPHLVGPGQASWLGALDMDREHLHAAARHAVGARRAAVAARLGAALWRYWYITGQYTTAVALLGDALALEDAEPGAASWPTVRYGLATIRYLQGDPAGAEALYEVALGHYRAATDAHGVSATLSNLGMISQYRGDIDGARRRFEEALAVARDGKVRRCEAVALANLGALHADVGDYAAADEHHGEAVMLFRMLGDARAVADELSNIAVGAAVLGDLDRADELAGETAHTYEAIGDRSGVGDVTRLLGNVALLRDDLETAIAHYERALSIATSLGDSWGEAECRSALAMLVPDLATARDHAVEALRLQQDLEHYGATIDAQLTWADVAARAGDRLEAHAVLRRAKEMLHADDDFGRDRVAIAAGAVARMLDEPLETSTVDLENTQRFTRHVVTVVQLRRNR